MRPYPTVQIQPETFQTILVKANKGLGKSKAGTAFLSEMLEKNPPASCVIIAGNVALASKHLEELHQAGMSDFVLYSDVEGPIEDKRVVVCINSMPRLSSCDKDIVYMDEIDMTLSNMNSDVMQNRRMVFMTLHAVVQEARIVKSGVGCKRRQSTRARVASNDPPTASIHAIRNSGVRASERTATIWPMPSSGRLRQERFAPIITQILDEVDVGLNIWVSFNDRYPSKNS